MTIIIPAWVISVATGVGVTLVVALAILGLFTLYVVFTFRK